MPGRGPGTTWFRIYDAQHATIAVDLPGDDPAATFSDYADVICQEDRIAAPEYSRRAARELLGVEAVELPGGQAPMASRPEALAKLLTA